MNRVCIHCGNTFLVCRSVPGQKFCSNSDCQRARKRIWQREKQGSDNDYCDNRKASQQKWRAANPAYMREYRARHKDYVCNNRIKQRKRNAKRKKALAQAVVPAASSSSLIVKTDELKAALRLLIELPSPLIFNLEQIVKTDELFADKQPLSMSLSGSLISGVDCKEVLARQGWPGWLHLRYER